MIKIGYRKFPQATLKVFDLPSTTFPDGTQQVWKLPELPFGEVKVYWFYEAESELIKIVQLGLLFKHESIRATLVVPYLPYARQDKEVSNTSCFAKATLGKFVEHFESVVTTDVHSDMWHHFHRNVQDEPITPLINEVLYDIARPVTIVYPDHGAYTRYNEDPILSTKPFIVLDKVRDQLSGKITHLAIKSITTDGTRQLPGDFVIVDDISDYGGTFLAAAKTLQELDPQSISLYVTHFLGHGDINRFATAGIQVVYTSDSLSYYRANQKPVDNQTTKVKIVGKYEIK